MYVHDDKLPDDVLRKAYSDSRHALCCIGCNFESFFNPTIPRSIGAPLMALVLHDCPADDLPPVQ